MEGKGKVALVTGANSGVGLELTKKLLAWGADVAALVRSEFPQEPELQTALAAGTLRVYRADLGDFRSLKQAVAAIRAQESKVDLLFANAGVAFPDLRRVAGHDGHFLINTVVPYILLEELGPLLEKGQLKRFVATSSISLAWVRSFSLELLDAPPKHIPIFGAYGRSKLALTLWTRAAADAWKPRGITLLTSCPGGTRTKMTTGPGPKSFVARFILPLVIHSAEEGATRIWDAAFDPQARHGDFFSNRKVVVPRWQDHAAGVLAKVKDVYEKEYQTA